MASEEHEKPQRDYQLAVRAEVSAHDGYAKSVKKSLENRDRTVSERVTAETRFFNHIRGCPVCQHEGRKGWEVDPHRLID
jgi:hypothetical protein